MGPEMIGYEQGVSARPAHAQGESRCPHLQQLPSGGALARIYREQLAHAVLGRRRDGGPGRRLKVHVRLPDQANISIINVKIIIIVTYNYY